jgi:hypothetical protein
LGKKNNSYTASFKLKVISFAEQFGNRAAQTEFGILESNVRYCRKQEELLKIAKSDSRAFRGLKAGKSAYFTHPHFSGAKLEKKMCANYASKYGICVIVIILLICIAIWLFPAGGTLTDFVTQVKRLVLKVGPPHL